MSAASKGFQCAQIPLLLEISGRALAAIGRFANSEVKSHRPRPDSERFGTVTVIIERFPVQWHHRFEWCHFRLMTAVAYSSSFISFGVK